jgi:putative transcriptional regulator
MKQSDFDGILSGLKDVEAYAKGEADLAAYRVHVPKEIDVRAIRQKLQLTQAAFAAQFGFSKAAVADWEQKRRTPEASARAFLTVIDREPKAVMKALRAS